MWPWGKCARLLVAAGWNGSGDGVVQAQHGQPTSDSTQGGFWNCDLLSREDRFLSRMAQYVKQKGEETPEGPGEQLCWPVSVCLWEGSGPQHGRGVVGRSYVEGMGLEDTAGLGVLSCVLHFKQARETLGSAED